MLAQMSLVDLEDLKRMVNVHIELEIKAAKNARKVTEHLTSNEIDELFCLSETVPNKTCWRDFYQHAVDYAERKRGVS